MSSQKITPKITLKYRIPECEICTEPKKDMLTCEICKCKFCHECFTNEFWSKPACMKCDVLLSNTSLVKWLTSEVFINVIVKKHHKAAALIREKALLSFTLLYIEWNKYQEVKKSFSRFGSQKVARGFVVNEELEALTLNTINPADIESSVANYIFYKCFKSCGGMVVYGACNNCKLVHCDKCQMLSDVHHKCDQSIIETLKAVKLTTKPCPKCAVAIYKDGGCDHMHCKKCNTHYFWSTGLIVNESGFNVDLPQHIYLTEEDSVNIQTVEVQVKKLLGIIQQFIFVKYNLQILTKKYNVELLKLRMKFIKNELTEDKWLDKVVMLDYVHASNIDINTVLTKFVDAGLKSLNSRILSIVKLSNMELDDISLTYNCKVPVIFKDSDIPIAMR